MRIKYSYDNCGNISEVRENGKLAVRYTYDALNRLVREDNKQLGKTRTYSYDNNGNILNKREFAFTLCKAEWLEETDCESIDYAYDGDRLLSYGSESYVYDGLGNPTTYRNKAVTWANGRQMTEYDGNTFVYDGRGRRTGKNAISFTYDSEGNLLKQSNGLEFIYDHSGVAGVKYNNTTYFYRRNAQGDIIALLDNTGKVVVKYVYDAWGNHEVKVLDSTCAELSQLNPFRYRGYYYDTETGLYFLQTRYYDPVVGRFVTIDDLQYLDPETINGLNLYAYCANNPVMAVDPDGTMPNWLKWLIGGFIIIGAIALSIATAGIGTAITGALGGGLVASIVGGAVGGAISGAVIGFGISIATQGIANGFGNIDWNQVGRETLFGTISGAVSGAVFAVAGRAVGLLGKKKWAQRPVDFSKSSNAFFGSKSGNFTFLRLGKDFRIEASIQHGIHTHYQTIKNGLIVVGRSVPRITLVNGIWNALTGLISSFIRKFSN